MDKAQASDRIKKLRVIIDDYRYHYHVLDESIMTEAAADSLKHELTQLEERYPDLITPDSPSQRVAGQALDKFEKVQHKYPMISLQDVFNRSEIDDWLARIEKLIASRYDEYFADIKMDGLACALIYEDGVLRTAITRGDGQVGENVTMNIRTIKNIPLRLRESNNYTKFLNGRTEIRGEIVMYKKDFDELNKRRELANQPLFMNPRNLSAGTIRQLDPKLVAERSLHFHAYDIIRDNPTDIPTHSYGYEVVKELGLTVNNTAAKFESLDSLMKYVDVWETERQNLKFNTDGIVIKINDRARYENLGVVGKTPRGAVAFKLL
jgi:DNA ligase (NAD+)